MLTVTVELPPVSEIFSGLTATLSVAVSSSSIVIVCALPTVAPPWFAVTSTVSSPSSTVSCTAATVAVTSV